MGGGTWEGAESTGAILEAQVLRDGVGYGGNGRVERRREKVSRGRRRGSRRSRGWTPLLSYESSQELRFNTADFVGKVVLYLYFSPTLTF